MHRVHENPGSHGRMKILSISLSSVLIILLLLTGLSGLLLAGVRDGEVVEVTGSDNDREPASSSSRESLTITEGKDTFLCNSFEMYGHEDSNFGGDAQIYIAWESGEGDQTFFPFRGMVMFDIAGLPTDIEITSAMMKLYYEESVDVRGNEAGVSVPLTVSAHPLTRSWVEGTNAWGDGAQPNGASWNTHDGSTAWNSPGGDYDGQSKVDANTPGAYGWVEWDIKEFVEAWVNGDSENHGVILITHDRPNEDYLKMLTSFEGQNNKPQLVIEYEEPNTPPTAVIDAIDPNPIKEFTNVTLTGHGDDAEDGTTNSGFMWKVGTDYTPSFVVGTQPVVEITNLTAGTYTVSFRVKDSKGVWSAYTTADEKLVVTPDEPPAKISDLSAEAHGGETGVINLTWNSVAEDGLDVDGKVTEYIVRYSESFMDGELAFNNAEEPGEEDEVPEPRNPGRDQEMTITGLDSGKEYYFCVISVDARGQRSPLSNVARAIAPDHNSPGMITDLVAAIGSGDGEVNLQWTAAGDDGIEGRASRYLIRYSDEEIRSAWDWYGAEEIPNSEDIPLPSHSSQKEVLTVTGLVGRTTYYFAVRAVDEWNNAGPMSNVAECIAKDGTPPGKVTGLLVFDTPDDNGKSITLTWNKVTEEDFDHYSIYKSMTAFTNVRLMEPAKLIDQVDKESSTLGVFDEVNLVDREEYYFAITAVDGDGNEDMDVLCFGPVMPLNNLRKAQWLSDPLTGEIHEGLPLSPSMMVDIEIETIDIVISSKDVGSGKVQITKEYRIDGQVTAVGDDVEQIDIYEGISEDGDDWEWSPLQDREMVENLDEHALDYYDKGYAAFIHPEQSGGEWTLPTYQIVEVLDREEAEDRYLSEDDSLEYRICAVAWTHTAQWSYGISDYVPELLGTIVDSDLDNLPDTWEKEHFNNIDLFGATDDPDGDGYSNLKEFQEDTDPQSPTSSPKRMDPDMKIPDTKSGQDEFPMGVVIAAILILVFGIILAVVIVVIRRAGRREREEPEPIDLPEPAAAPKAPEEPVNPCPRCNRPMAYKEEYQRWQCNSCGSFTYGPREGAAPEPVVMEQSLAAEQSYNCERCGGILDYDYLSGEWLCPACSHFESQFSDHGASYDESEGEDAYGLPGTSSLPALPPHLAGSSETTDEGEEVRQSYEETKAMVDRAPPYIDVSGPLSVLERAADEIERSEFEKAAVSIEESKDMVTTIHNRYTELVAKSENILARIKELKEQGLDTTGMLELFNIGKDSMMSGDFDSCQLKFDEALSAMEAGPSEVGANAAEPVAAEPSDAPPEVKLPSFADVVKEENREEAKEEVGGEAEPQAQPPTAQENAEAPTEEPEPEPAPESTEDADAIGKAEKKADSLDTSLDDDLADLEDLLGM